MKKKHLNSLVSIIVPIYNVEKYLSRCVDSIIKQSYENIEIILIDDGSKDKSGEIADTYADISHKVNVFHKENGGLSDARNYGLSNAKGKYVCFIDSDDYVHCDFVKQLVNICEKYNCEIAQCSFQYTTISNQIREDADSSIKVFTNIQMLNQLYNETYLNTVVAWNKMYRKDLFTEIKYPTGRIHEDEATTYKLIYAATQIGITAEKLYFYYQNSESIMHKKYSLKRLDILYAIEERKKFYFEKGLIDLSYKDCYRYLTKILINYYHIYYIDLDEGMVDKKNVLRELRKKYISSLKECRCTGWSFKRRIMLMFFRFLPLLYVPFMRPDQK